MSSRGDLVPGGTGSTPVCAFAKVVPIMLRTRAHVRILAIPVVIAAVPGNRNWARSSRWFLGTALILPVVQQFSPVRRG